jgi:hypothetical protein
MPRASWSRTLSVSQLAFGPEFFKKRMELNEFLAVQDSAFGGKGENRFYTAAALRNNADRACRCDGRAGSVSHRPVVLGVPDTSLPIREATSFFCEFFTRLMGMFLDEKHKFLCEFSSLFTAVSNSKKNQGVCKAHNPQAHLVVAKPCLLNLRDRIVVGVDHIVEEPDGQMNRFGQRIPVQITSIFSNELMNRDRAQATGFVGQKRLPVFPEADRPGYRNRYEWTEA